MIIKVCGMRDADNIQQLSQIEEIDWMGFIFTDKSSRFALDIKDFDTNTNKRKVGVFVDETIEDILKYIRKFNLDIVQLHGFETPEYCDQLKVELQSIERSVEIMKAFRVDSKFDFSSTRRYSKSVDYFLFDAKGENAGGNGIAFDWSVLERYDGDTLFLLAGGINPSSISKIEAFRHPKWIGIDINSGFEDSPGLKNIEALHLFTEAISQPLSPAGIVRQFVKRFNKSDVQGLVQLYHEDAINHQVVNDPVIGKSAIRSMFAMEFDKARMTCIPENIFEDGNWSILEWKDPLGLRGCGFFKIEKGKIIFQRGYWDRLSFLRQHNMALPNE